LVLLFFAKARHLFYAKLLYLKIVYKEVAMVRQLLGIIGVFLCEQNGLLGFFCTNAFL